VNRPDIALIERSRVQMKIGVVGLGYWGPNIVRNLIALGHDVCVFDMQQSRIDSVIRRFPACCGSATLEDLLSNEAVSAVAIAVPLPAHCDLILRALDAGKHVFVEKPLCATVEEADAVGQRLNGNVLMTGHITQFNKGIDILLRSVREERIGSLRRASFVRTHLGPVYRETDVLTEVAAHDVAIISSLWPSGPREVYAWGVSRRTAGSIDAAHLVLRMGNGCMAQVDVEWSSVVRRREIEVEGTTGTLLYRGHSSPEELLLFAHDKSYALLDDEEMWRQAAGNVKVTPLDISGAEPLRDELSHFVECIVHHTDPRTNFQFSRNIVAILEAARTSMRNDGSMICLQ
jgi:predicted dehydrogenase